MSGGLRTHVIKVRLSGDELAALRERAMEAPLAEWLRSLGLGQPVVRKRRRTAEVHLHPISHDILRQMVWAGNRLRVITTALEESGQEGIDVEQVRRVVNELRDDLHRCWEVANDPFRVPPRA